MLVDDPRTDQRGERRGTRIVGEHAAVDEGIAARRAGHIVGREIDRRCGAAHHGVDDLRAGKAGIQSMFGRLLKSRARHSFAHDGMTALS
jgi:hypothetical protein